LKKQTKKNIPPKSKLQEYFSTFLFRWVRASDEKTYSESKPLRAALNYKYIDPNNNGYIRILTIDVDWKIPLEDYIDRVPIPNVIISNPENGHVQIMYFLQSRVYRENAKIMYAYLMVKNNLNRTLKGDFSFAGRLQKNPLHPYWNAAWFNNAPYALTDLINWSREQDMEPTEDSCRVHDFSSRNETVFHSLLKYACRYNKELTYEILEAHAERLNNSIPSEFDTTIKIPLDSTELRGIARSVWKFMKTQYTRCFKRGEGQYTEEQRKRSIESRVTKKWKNIHRFIEYRKLKISFKRIAEILGVSLKTIKNYASALRPDSPYAGSSPAPDPTSGSSINYAYADRDKQTGAGQQHGFACHHTPPVFRWITDTVFHRIDGLLGVDELADKELTQDTS
jgi:hypothetical protein